jgi:hypothetical protein
MVLPLENPASGALFSSALVWDLIGLRVLDFLGVVHTDELSELDAAPSLPSLVVPLVVWLFSLLSELR